LRFVEGIADAPSEIRIVHGDTGAKRALKNRFQGLGYTGIMIP
jgi:metallo-beta-lactamase family protein